MYFYNILNFQIKNELDWKWILIVSVMSDNNVRHGVQIFKQ